MRRRAQGQSVRLQLFGVAGADHGGLIMSRELRDPLLDDEAPPVKDDVEVAAPTPGEAAAALEDKEYKSTLCLIRGLYFLSGVSNVSWGRFAAVFYVSIGLDAFQIGILEGVMPVTASVCQPFWGYLSDKTRNRKRVFLITKVVASLILLLQAVPLFVDVGFPAILAISIGMSMFSAPGVLDAYALDVLGKSSGDYGTLRLWCALSWGLGSTLMGFVTGRHWATMACYGLAAYHIDGICFACWSADLMDGDFTYNFAIYAAFAFVGTALIAWKVPNKSKSEKEVKSSDLHVKQLIQAACAKNMIGFWGLAVVFGICESTTTLMAGPVLCVGKTIIFALGRLGIAVVERLLFVFLQTELNASTTLCGGTVGVSVLFELPVFYWGKRILRWAGHDLMFLTVCLDHFQLFVMFGGEPHWPMRSFSCLHILCNRRPW